MGSKKLSKAAMKVRLQLIKESYRRILLLLEKKEEDALDVKEENYLDKLTDSVEEHELSYQEKLEDYYVDPRDNIGEQIRSWAYRGKGEA